MQLFARMLKVDEVARTVCGVIASEARDRSGEVFDYASSKPHFEEWSGSIAKATEGKSVGNLRAQHGSVVAGKLTDITMDDVTKAITVTAHIVDDNEWNKVSKGCYGGFSIGGAYVRKWDDAGTKRYTAKPSEVSIVDMPCNPDATFTVIKADGSEEMRKFHVESLKKNLYDVATLANILSQLGYVADDVAWEASWEADGSSIPADLRDAIKALGAILVRMTKEEVDELTADDPLALAAKAGLRKTQLSEEDAMNDELKKAHDAVVADLAKATGERDTLQKALDASKADLAKAVADVAERDEMLTKAAERINSDALVIKANNTAIEAFKALPAPMKVAMHAVAKSADAAQADDKEPEQVLKRDGTVDESLTALRKALNNPINQR